MIDTHGRLDYQSGRIHYDFVLTIEEQVNYSIDIDNDFRMALIWYWDFEEDRKPDGSRRAPLDLTARA